MNAKRQRGRRGTRAAGPVRPQHADGSDRSGAGEAHGDRYGQLADWIGVSTVGGGGADDPSTVAFVGGIAGVRAIRWWAWRLARFVRRGHGVEPPGASDQKPGR